MTEKIFQERIFCYRDNMYRFARNLLENDAEAQDAVQSVMLSLWQHKEQLLSIGSARAYVMRAVKNECINKIRHRQMNGRHLAIAGSLQPVSEHILKSNMSAIIHRFMATLPEKQKMVMLLKDVEEFDTHEIASMLGMEETAVRTNLARARQKVRDHLQKIETYEQQQVQ